MQHLKHSILIGWKKYENASDNEDIRSKYEDTHHCRQKSKGYKMFKQATETMILLEHVGSIVI